jgi:hypothetical protein
MSQASYAKTTGVQEADYLSITISKPSGNGSPNPGRCVCCCLPTIRRCKLSKKKEMSSHCQLHLLSENLTCVKICMNITRFKIQGPTMREIGLFQLIMLYYYGTLERNMLFGENRLMSNNELQYIIVYLEVIAHSFL